MQPIDVQVIGNALAIKWDDQKESFVPIQSLRHSCPCAGCRGEKDIMGNVYQHAPKPLTTEAFALIRLTKVGGYALRPVWADGHDTGLFSFDYLRQLGEANEKSG